MAKADKALDFGQAPYVYLLCYGCRVQTLMLAVSY